MNRVVSERVRRRKWRRWGGVAYLVLVGAMAGLALRSEWGEIRAAIITIEVVPLLLAVVTSVSALVVAMVSFKVVLEGLGPRVSLFGASELFFISQVGKYLPGSVWPVVVQARIAKHHEIGLAVSLASSFLTLALSIAVGATTGFVALAVVDSTWLPFAVVSVLALGLGASSIRFFWKRRHRLPQRVRRGLPEQLPSLSALFHASVLLVLTWCLHGAHLALLALGLGVEIDKLWARSLGAFAIAVVGGIIFVVAPAGAGVREVILAAIMGSVDGVTLATLVLLSRVVLLLTDLSFALATGLAARVLRARQGVAPLERTC